MINIWTLCLKKHKFEPKRNILKKKGINIFHGLFCIFLILIFVFQENSIYAQGLSEGEQKVEDEAFMLFTKKEYDKAMPLFSQLLSLHPQDPVYNYGYGVCLIETNTGTKKALKYLKYAQSKSQNPVIFYYIGRSYHLNYEFDKAISNYQHFKEKAPKSTLTEFDVDQKIRMAQNGKELINFVSDLIVLENKKIKDENFFYSYRINDINGKIIVTPKSFKTKADIKKKYRGITFIWNDTLAFFASYGNNKKGKLDIYRASKQPDGNWSTPVKLPFINTSYDENFPYLSPDGKTFYFSSKGFNSMGGYDIFKISYNDTSNILLKPENMDFPINSPFDDLLYVVDRNNQFAYFASKRETGNDLISVYRIAVDKNRRKRPAKGLEDIIDRAKLNVTLLSERQPVDESAVNDITENKTKEQQNTKTLTLPELQPKKITDNIAFKQAVKDDKQIISKNLEQTENLRDIILVTAYEKSTQADALKKKAKTILENLDQVPDKKEQAFLKQEAQGMLDDAIKLNKEAIVAYNISKHLSETAEYKKQDKKVIESFLEKINSGMDSDSLFQAYNKVCTQVNKNQSKYVTIDKEITLRNKIIAKNLGIIKNNQIEITKYTEKINHISDNIIAIEQQITNASPQEKTNLEENLQNQKDKLKQLVQEKTYLTNKTNYLIAQNTDIHDEINYLKLLKQNTNQININEVHQKLAEINEATLSKRIAETKTDIEMDMAERIANNSDTSEEQERFNTDTHQEILANKQDDTKKTFENQTSDIATNKQDETQITDSLQTLVAQKQQLLKQTTDSTKKQNLKTEIQDLSQILNAVGTQNNETIQKQKNVKQAESKQNPTIESKFPDIRIKSGDNTAVKYEKTFFKQQYLTQLIAEQENKLENLEAVKKDVDDPATIASLNQQIEALAKQIAENKTKLNETEKYIVSLKQELEKTKQVKQLSDAELILMASEYVPKNQLKITDNPNDQQELMLLEQQAKEQHYKYMKLKKKAEELQKQSNKNKDKNIEKQLNKIRQEKQTAFLNYLNITNRLNTLKYYYYDDKIYDTKVISGDPKSKEAYELTNEAEYYFNLSKSMQEAATNIELEDLKEQEIKNSLVFQEIAIEKQKHALDLYVSLNNMAIKSKEKNTNRPSVQLSSDAIAKLKTADKIYYKSIVSKKEANTLHLEAKTLRDEAENTFDKKKKTKLLAKAKEKEQESKRKYSEALRNSITADSLKFSVNAIFIDSLFTKSSTKNVNLANLYVKESYIYNNAAEQLRIRTFREENQDSLLAINTKIQDFYQKAVSNQESAIAALTKEPETNFIAVSPITKVNSLTTVYNKNVDTRKIPIIDEKILFANLNFSETDKQTLDLANKIEKKSLQKINQAKIIEEQIIDLEKEINTSTNQKQINTNKKKLAKLQNKRNLLLANAYDDYEPINYTRYDILKTQLHQARRNGDKTHRKEAIQLAVNAQKDFQKASRIRDASFMIKDRKTVCNDLEKAYHLEKKAIAEIEKAIALYKGLVPEFNNQPLQAKTDTSIKTYDFATKNTGDITPIKTKTTNQDTSLLASNEIKHTEKTDTLNNNVIDTLTITSYNKNQDTNTIQQTTSETTPLPVSQNDITVSLPSQIHQGETYTVTATIYNKSQKPTFARCLFTFPKSFIVSNIRQEDAKVTIKGQTLKLLWMNLPKGKSFVHFQIETNTTTYFADSVYIVFEYILNDSVNKINIRKYIEVIPSEEIIAENKQTANSDNNNTNNIISTDNIIVEQNDEKARNEKTIVDEKTLNFQEDSNNISTVKTISNKETPYSFVPFNAYTTENPIPINPVLPSGIIFKIQLGAFSKPIPDNTFKGLNPIAAERTKGSSYYKYLLGLFKTFDAAQVGKLEVHKMGYRDAFIVAYKDGKRIPIYQARNLSQTDSKKYKQLAQEEISKIRNRTVTTTGNKNIKTEQLAVTPITKKKDLIYTVQIGVFKKQPKTSYFRGLSPIFTEKTPYGFIRYFTGVFNSVDKAKTEKDKIIRLGISDAFVVAYYNGKRILLPEAENLEKQGKKTGKEEIISYPETEIPKSKQSYIYNKTDIWFSVQVGAYKNSVPLDAVTSLVNISRDNEIKQIKDNKGYTLFIIGNFTNYNKAKELASILKNDGIKDCFVIAFNKTTKIPLVDAIRTLSE